MTSTTQQHGIEAEIQVIIYNVETCSFGTLCERYFTSDYLRQSGR